MRKKESIFPPNIFRPPDEKNVRIFEELLDIIQRGGSRKKDGNGQDDSEKESRD